MDMSGIQCIFISECNLLCHTLGVLKPIPVCVLCCHQRSDISHISYLQFTIKIKTLPKASKSTDLQARHFSTLQTKRTKKPGIRVNSSKQDHERK